MPGGWSKLSGRKLEYVSSSNSERWESIKHSRLTNGFDIYSNIYNFQENSFM